MPEIIDDAEFTISGAYGEVYYVDPTGARAPRRIWEINSFSATKEKTTTAIPIAGNQQGDKDGPVSKQGTFSTRLVDAFFQNLALEQMPGNDDERRRQRDSGARRRGGFTLQVWMDDPDALGALGYQFEGVKLRKFDVAFDITTVATAQEHPFTFREVSRLKSFEKVGNEVDVATGMPAIAYLTPDDA